MQNDKNRGCNFFKWVEPQTCVCCDRACVCCDRVMSMLMDWQQDLKSERAMEVFKCKTEIAQYKLQMEAEAANFARNLERQENKYHGLQLKFQFAVACCWCLIGVIMFFPSCNRLALRLMLTG
jgi:hypothetical protein